MKFIRNLFAVFAALMLFGAAAQTKPVQQFSEKTHQAPPSAVIKAEKDASGNAKVSWEGIQVASVEHYIGHGRKGGFVAPVNVGAAKYAMLADLPKNGGRLNVKTTDGLYLHIECGGNNRTTEPKLVGLKKDCSHKDPVTGQVVGALVID